MSYETTLKKRQNSGETTHKRNPSRCMKGEKREGNKWGTNSIESQVIDGSDLAGSYIKQHDGGLQYDAPFTRSNCSRRGSVCLLGQIKYIFDISVNVKYMYDCFVKMTSRDSCRLNLIKL